MKSLTLACSMLILAMGLASAQSPKNAFHFVEKKGESLDLKFGDRDVLRFVNKPGDGTDEDSHYMSFK